MAYASFADRKANLDRWIVPVHSGFSYDKSLGLRPRFLSTCVPPSGHVFNIAWQAMIKTYNDIKEKTMILWLRVHALNSVDLC